VIPIKIQETLNAPSNVSGVSGKDDRKVSENKEVSFQSRLKHVEDRNAEERLQDMADQIIKQGEKLGKKMDIRELKIYKNLVSEFLDEAVNNSHTFEKKNFLDRRGRHKIYATVKKVNEELDNLTKDVLSSEKDNIKILQRLDDIRGMILDISL
jgi:uncharacterized protein